MEEARSDRSARSTGLARALQVSVDELLAETNSDFEKKPTAKKEATQSVPFLPMKVAAGAFRDGERPADVGFGRIDVYANLRLPAGAFAAEIRGDSMEPRVPDGSIAIFAPGAPANVEGKILLVEHRIFADPAFGSGVAVKRIGSVEVLADGRRIVVLSRSIHVSASFSTTNESSRILAEFVRVVPAPPRA